MNKDKNRQAFEKEFPPPLPDKDGDTDYLDLIIHVAKWEAWQTATKRQNALIAAAYEDAERCASDRMFGDTFGEVGRTAHNNTCAQISDSIRSRTPADAQKALDELLMKAISETEGIMYAEGNISEEEKIEIIERVKK